jgi:transcriptional regulator NrdR family protein
VKCPFCGDIGDKVVDSRESREGDAIRRRRHCLRAVKQRSRLRGIEGSHGVKKDGTRERFERSKLVAGCKRKSSRQAGTSTRSDRAQLINVPADSMRWARCDAGLEIDRVLSASRQSARLPRRR